MHSDKNQAGNNLLQLIEETGAGEAIRTPDPNLGKVAMLVFLLLLMVHNLL